MNNYLNNELAQKYNSNTQKARVITEDWLLNNFTCPYCDLRLKSNKANSKCEDFFCEKCSEVFELKSKNGKFSNKKIIGSNYKATVDRIKSERGVNWILLERKGLYVNNLTFIPKNAVLDDMIEKRKPLKSTAKRANWTGCYIWVDKIPSFMKIQYMKDGKEIDKKIIKYRLEKSEKLRRSDFKNETWKLQILFLIDKLPGNIFTLNQLTSFISELQNKYQKNNNIDARIRSALQVLRDEEFIKFEGKGVYIKLF